jgi:hypothetical protein
MKANEIRSLNASIESLKSVNEELKVMRIPFSQHVCLTQDTRGGT